MPLDQLVQTRAAEAAAIDAAVLGPLMARLSELDDPGLLMAVADELERSAEEHKRAARAAAAAAQRLRERTEHV